MVPEDDAGLTLDTLFRDLDSVRHRLDQAQDWLRDGVTSVMAAALAEKTKHLCQQASQCEEESEILELLEQAKETLGDLEKLLGLH